MKLKVILRWYKHYNNMIILLLNFDQSVVLQQIFKARAVWTTINESFHVCWDSHNTTIEPLPAPTVYIIRDSIYQNLTYILYNPSIKSYCADIRQLSTSKSVILQAVSQTALPSVLLHVNISGK